MEFKKSVKVEIDEIKLRKLQNRVLFIERENFKTKRLKNNEIIDKIIKLISQEVDNVN